MNVRDIISILDAEVIAEGDLDIEVKTACGSDMMSDVLAFVKDQSVLLTGLMNPQVIRTAEMMDMICIVFVRNKRPSEEMIALARDHNIVLMSTPKRMYEACGILYSEGLNKNSRPLAGSDPDKNGESHA